MAFETIPSTDGCVKMDAATLSDSTSCATVVGPHGPSVGAIPSSDTTSPARVARLPAPTSSSPASVLSAEGNNDPSWLHSELQKLPLAELYPDLLDECLQIIEEKWKPEFPYCVWSKLMKQTQSRSPRIAKELNEIAPVVQRVREFVAKASVSDDDDRFTIVDLGCGLGFLGMLLSELLAAGEQTKGKVKEVFLVDLMWPKNWGKKTVVSGRGPLAPGAGAPGAGAAGAGAAGAVEGAAGAVQQKSVVVSAEQHQKGDDRHMTTAHLGCRSYPIPLRTLKLDLKKGRDLADLVHYVFRNGRKADRGKGNSIGTTTSCTASCTTSSPSPGVVPPPPKKNRIILLGVHLCGSLSLRAADLSNRNPDCVEFACIKPCCLPGKMHLRHEVLYKVGLHQFTAEELYYPDGLERPRWYLEMKDLVDRHKKDPGNVAEREEKMTRARERKLKRRAARRAMGAEESTAVVGAAAATMTTLASEEQSGSPMDHEQASDARGGDFCSDSEPDEDVLGGAGALDDADKTDEHAAPMTRRGHLRFETWCGHVERCVEVNSREAVVQRERIMVQPFHYQNEFIFVERARDASRLLGTRTGEPGVGDHDHTEIGPKDAGAGPTGSCGVGGGANQLLFPQFQRKKEEREARKRGAASSVGGAGSWVGREVGGA